MRDKPLLFLLLIVAAIWGATRLFQSPVVDSTPVVQASNNTASSSMTSSSSRSQEKSGIEVSIEAIEQRGGTTVLTLSLNNHQFDLSPGVIYDDATLNGVPSLSHTFLGEPSGGGHHAQVEVVFPLATEGSFTIAPTQDTVFTFDNLW